MVRFHGNLDPPQIDRDAGVDRGLVVFDLVHAQDELDAESVRVSYNESGDLMLPAQRGHLPGLNFGRFVGF
jgi:hypothetical protein